MVIKSKKFKDISFDISPNLLTGDLKTLNNEEAIKNSVKNLVLTQIGERLSNKYIGTNITSYLFEVNLIFVRAEIESEIREIIRTFEPRVLLQRIEVFGEDHTLKVNISFLIIGEQRLQELEFILLRES